MSEATDKKISQLYLIESDRVTGNERLLYAQVSGNGAMTVASVKNYVAKQVLAQGTGTATDKAISQKAVSDALFGMYDDIDAATSRIALDRDVATFDAVVLSASIAEASSSLKPGDDNARLVFLTSDKKFALEVTDGATVTYYNNWTGRDYVCDTNLKPLRNKIYIYAYNNTQYIWDGVNLTRITYPLEQSTGTGVSSVMSQKAVTDAVQGLAGRFVTLTEAQYEALEEEGEIDDNAYYFITE